MVTELVETVSRRAPIVVVAAPQVQSFYERLGFAVQPDKLNAAALTPLAAGVR